MDLQTLKELGLNINEIQSEIIESASKQVASMIYKEIVEDIRRKTQEMVSKKISETLIDALNKEYQPVDDYGYIIGEKTSLREQFVKSTKEWWSQKVDTNGKATNSSYNSMPRHQYIAKEVIGDVLEKTLKEDLYKLVAESKEMVRIGIAKEVVSLIDQVWQKK